MCEGGTTEKERSLPSFFLLPTSTLAISSQKNEHFFFLLNLQSHCLFYSNSTLQFGPAAFQLLNYQHVVTGSVLHRLCWTQCRALKKFLVSYRIFLLVLPKRKLIIFIEKQKLKNTLHVLLLKILTLCFHQGSWLCHWLYDSPLKTESTFLVNYCCSHHWFFSGVSLTPFILR